MRVEFSGKGNLGGKPEVREDPDGEKDPVCNFSVHLSSGYMKDDEFVDTGSFWQECELWGRKAKVVSELFKKGDEVYVEGSLRRQTWVDKDSGEDRENFRLRVDTIYPTLKTLEKRLSAA